MGPRQASSSLPYHPLAIKKPENFFGSMFFLGKSKKVTGITPRYPKPSYFDDLCIIFLDFCLTVEPDPTQRTTQDPPLSTLHLYP